MATVVETIKKKKKDTESVLKQVIGGIRSDWSKLLDALEPNPNKKKLAKPGK